MTFVLDCGFMARDKDGVLSPIVLADGSLPKCPVLLDGNGGILPPGKDPVYVVFDENFVRIGFARNSAGEGFTTAVPYWLN